VCLEIRVVVSLEIILAAVVGVPAVGGINRHGLPCFPDTDPFNFFALLHILHIQPRI
jgi:hypothetical protein